MQVLLYSLASSGGYRSPPFFNTMRTAAYPGLAFKIPHQPEKFLHHRIPATGKRNPNVANVIAVPELETQTRQTNADEPVAAFWDYQFLFISQRSESREPVTLRTVEGAIPPDFPSGTYYLAGPGLFSDDHGSTVNPLDGHGYLRAFTVDGNSGEVRFSARYVETEAQREEHDRSTGKWRFTHRGPFSVLKGGRKIGNTKVMKNVANTSVLRWGRRLLCLWEGGDPYEVEPETLKTVGLFHFFRGSSPERRFSGDGTCVSSPELETCGVKFDGVEPEEEPESGERLPRFGSFKPESMVIDLVSGFLKPILHGVFKMPATRLLSHYKIDPRLNRLLIISCNAEDMLLPCSHFTIYELDDDFNLLQKQEFIIPDHLMIHDWAFTENHYILVANRIKLDVAGSVSALCGLTPMISALSTNHSRTTSPIYLLPRFPHSFPGKRDWRVPIEAPSQLWLLHVGNAFEERINGEGNLHIQMHASACSYQWINFQKMFGYNWENHKLDPSYMNAGGSRGFLPHLVQVSVELNPNGHCNRCTVQPLNQWTHVSDFPVINPGFWGRKNKYIYSGTSLCSRQSLPHFPFDTVAKLNLSSGSIATWSVGKRRFIGEPIFVPRGVGEDEGYILVVEYAVSIQRCYLVILDSQRIGDADALVAKLEVPKHLNFPMGFHGFWAQQDCNL